MKKTTQGVLLAGMVAGFLTIGCAKTVPATEVTGETTKETVKSDAGTTEKMIESTTQPLFYKCTGETVVTGPKTSDCSGHGGGATCAGTNDCKGKGWKKMTKADCIASYGKVNEVAP